MSRFYSGPPEFPNNAPGYPESSIDLPQEMKEALTADELAAVARTQATASGGVPSKLVAADTLGTLWLFGLVLRLFKRLIWIGHKPDMTATA